LQEGEKTATSLGSGGIARTEETELIGGRKGGRRSEKRKTRGKKNQREEILDDKRRRGEGFFNRKGAQGKGIQPVVQDEQRKVALCRACTKGYQGPLGGVFTSVKKKEEKLGYIHETRFDRREQKDAGIDRGEKNALEEP